MAKETGFIALATVSLGVNIAAAGVYHWTGAALDGMWDTAGNWQENEVPGMWTNRTEHTFGGKLGDTVIFGAQADGAPTTIDLQGQYAIENLIVTNGAPAYTFGTADWADQRLGFQTNSTLEIAADVTADQTFMRPATWNGDPSSKLSSKLYFKNNSTQAKLIYGSLDKTTDRAGSPYATVTFSGAGDIDVTGNALFDQVGTLTIDNRGRVSFGNATHGGSRYANVYFSDISGITHEMELPAGKFIGSKGGSWTWVDNVKFFGNTHIYGDGFVNICCSYNLPVEDAKCSTRLRVTANKKAVIDVGIASKDAASDFITVTEAASEIYLNGTNSLPGRLRLHGSGSTLARLIGNKNCAADQTSVGRGDAIVFEHSWTCKTKKENSVNHADIATLNINGAPVAKFYYTGTGETTDKDIVVSNLFSAAGNVTLGNRGTGTLTWNGNALQIDGSPGTTFTLDAQTAPIVFGGLFEAGRTWNLAVAGDSSVSFSQAQPGVTGSITISGGVLETASLAQTFPNASSLVFAGGTLKMTQGGTMSLSPTYQAGANGIELVDGTDLTLASLSLPANATFNVSVPVGATVSVTVTGATPGALPSTVTWNGARAKIDENGHLVPHVSNWREAQDGKWNTPANWDNGVPEADASAFVTAAGGSYTVEIDGAPTHAINDLHIANAGPGVATVAATTEYDMGAATVDLQPGGALAAGEGGTLYITNATVLFNGGSINGSGDGLVNVPSKFKFESGTNTFSGTSCLQIGLPTKSSQHLYMTPTPGTPCVLTFSDTAKYWLYQGYWFVCNNVPGGRAILNFDGTDETSFTGGSSTFYGLSVGTKQGYGELNLKHGSLYPGNFGVFVAADSPDSSSSTTTEPLCVTGVVNQTGGLLSVSSWGWHYAPMACGLVVGDGTRINKSNADVLAKSECVGYYNLSGGKVTINRGVCVVGGGVGTGFFNLSGGQYYHNSYDTTPVSSAMPLVIGMGLRGRGVWTMTGGTTDIRNHVYVGGAELEDLQLLPGPSATYFPDGDGCTGILDVSNGTFVTTKDLYVGAKGTGTLVLRPTATIEAENVVLSNGVASVVRAVVVGKATGRLTATENLVITDESRIEIDATAMSAKAPLFTRIAAANDVVGEFSPEKISFEYDETNAEMRSAFAQAEIVYELNGERGIWLKTTTRGTLMIFR